MSTKDDGPRFYSVYADDPMYVHLVRQAADLRAENERLRAALEHIATHEHNGCNAWQGIVAHDRNVAKKALGND